MNFDIKKVKITVTAPMQNIEEIRNSVCDEGAGIIHIVLLLQNV